MTTPDLPPAAPQHDLHEAGYIEQSTTACCPRESIPDCCQCPDDCPCNCQDCGCYDWRHENDLDAS